MYWKAALRVLIAEDDPFFRTLLQELLSAEADVKAVEDGAAAWNWLQQCEGPAVAILDWAMPGMAGPQICRAARANPSLARVYLILLTGRNSSAEILAGLRCGADDYVTKPFEPEELRARFRLGQRIVRLEQSLDMERQALQDALRREQLLKARLAPLEQVAEQKMAKAASA
jgi:DNA-binding response OmpR family regulator